MDANERIQDSTAFQLNHKHDLREELRENDQFRLWIILIAATATVIGLFLLWIFTQVFFFRKPTFCCLTGGFFSSEISQIRLGRASLQLEQMRPPDLPPSYAQCRLNPPSYEETLRLDQSRNDHNYAV